MRLTDERTFTIHLFPRGILRDALFKADRWLTRKRKTIVESFEKLASSDSAPARSASRCGEPSRVSGRVDAGENRLLTQLGSPLDRKACKSYPSGLRWTVIFGPSLR